MALAPVPTAGGLSGKRTVGSAPARGTGARRSGDGEALGDGDRVLVARDADGALVVLVALVALVVAADAVVVVDDSADAGAPPSLHPAATITAATRSARGAGLT